MRGDHHCVHRPTLCHYNTLFVLFLAFVGMLSSGSEKPVWIGFSSSPGSWQFWWSNNDHISHTYWAPGQPGSSTPVGTCQLTLIPIPKYNNILKTFSSI